MFQQPQQQQPKQPKYYQVLERQQRTSKNGGQYTMLILGNMQKGTKQNGILSNQCVVPIEQGKTYAFQWQQTQGGGWIIIGGQEVPGIQFNPAQFKDSQWGGKSGGSNSGGGKYDSEGQEKGNYRNNITAFIIAKNPTFEQVKAYNELIVAAEKHYLSLKNVTNVPNVPPQTIATPQTAAPVPNLTVPGAPVDQFNYGTGGQ